MVKTFGLTHLALAVRDAERSFNFYRQVFGIEAYFREDGRIHARTPGCHDVITFDQNASAPGDSGGAMHFGFRLVSPSEIDEAAREVEQAGGRVLERGEFSPGLPYLYAADPDGYTIEIWFE